MEMNDEQRKKLEIIKGKVQNKQLQNLTEVIDELRKDLKSINWVRNAEYEKLIIEKVITELPEQMKIDWENMPDKEKSDFADIIKAIIEAKDETINAIENVEPTDLSPIKMAMAELQKSIVSLFKLAVSALNKIVFILVEPNEIIRNGDVIIEMYGDRKVTYSITRSNGKITRVVRNES